MIHHDVHVISFAPYNCTKILEMIVFSSYDSYLSWKLIKEKNKKNELVKIKCFFKMYPDVCHRGTGIYFCRFLHLIW